MREGILKLANAKIWMSSWDNFWGNAKVGEHTHTHKKEMHIILFTLLVGLDLDARVEEVDKITIQPSIIVL
jgi:hypothetical protein